MFGEAEKASEREAGDREDEEANYGYGIIAYIYI